MYDAIVVGARCAGSATAMLLARRGYRVLLLDRATFPSDTISGHFIQYPGVRKLADWGLLESVLATNCPPINIWADDVGDFRLSAEIVTPDGLPACIAPRRTVLDALLLDAARAAGVEVREGVRVTELLNDDNQVIGIRARMERGTLINERAHIVIGADGKHSTVAKLVGAERYREVDPLTCWYMSYWSDLPLAGIEISWRPQRAVFSIPTNDGLSLLAVAWPHREFHHFRADVEGNYMATLEMMPAVRERLTGARRVERIVGMADLPNFFHKPYGQGWALVGDAGHHKDPLLALGITDAFCDAALLADAVDAGLSGRESMLEALAQYEQLRDKRAIPENELNLQAAQLEGWNTPDTLALRAALRNKPVDAGHYFAIRAGVISAASFFQPENIQRIMGA